MAKHTEHGEATHEIKPRKRRAILPNQELLTPREAAETFGIAQRTLFDLVTRGVLPVVRIPTMKRTYYRRSDLHNLVNNSVMIADSAHNAERRSVPHVN